MGGSRAGSGAPKTPVPVRALRDLGLGGRRPTSTVPRQARIGGQIGAVVALTGRPTSRVQVAGVRAQMPAVRMSPRRTRLRRLSPAVRWVSQAWFFVVPR